jgi:hypothetical protein
MTKPKKMTSKQAKEIVALLEEAKDTTAPCRLERSAWLLLVNSTSSDEPDMPLFHWTIPGLFGCLWLKEPVQQSAGIRQHRPPTIGGRTTARLSLVRRRTGRHVRHTGQA